jgi:hypothetical protein
MTLATRLVVSVDRWRQGMAKRVAPAGRDNPSTPSNKPQKVLGTFAEDLGKLLGTAQAKASSWLDQRKAIATQLEQIRDTANEYLQRLVGGGRTAAPRRGRPPGSKTRRAQTAKAGGAQAAKADGRRGRRKGRMSAAGRAAISAAQKKRWAAIRKAKGRTDVRNG